MKIDELIEEWYTTYTGDKTLAEFLSMTRGQHKLWVETGVNTLIYERSSEPIKHVIKPTYPTKSR